MVKELEVIAGPMNSGKSTELIRELRRRKIAGMEVLVVKPAVDHRSTLQILSKDGPSLPAVEVTNSEELVHLATRFVHSHPKRQIVIGIDEAQFFDPHLPGAIRHITHTLDCQVIVAGLPRDFRGEPFGPMPIILAMAQHIQSLEAICTHEEGGAICGQRASETYRSIDGQPASFDDPIIVIGDKQEGYTSRCVRHHVVRDTPPPRAYPHTGK